MRPQIKAVYVLIHSPLVGGLTWTFVADELQKRGPMVVLPLLNDITDSKQPYWQQHVSSVTQALVGIPKAIPLILAAHSGAGPLLPAVRQLIPNPVRTYVFVDAGIPRYGATRLGLMESEDANWAKDFQTYLEGGGRFPTWSSADLQEIVPDKNIRDNLITELRSHGLDFFNEPIPVFEDWPDAPCVYIQFSVAYDKPAEQARVSGWHTYTLEAGHFHMLVDPKAVTDLLIDAVDEIS